jgi:hypothetical protein
VLSEVLLKKLAVRLVADVSLIRGASERITHSANKDEWLDSRLD